MIALPARPSYVREEFVALPDDQFEFVRRRVEIYTSHLSALVAGKVVTRLSNCCDATSSGLVFACGTEYRCLSNEPEQYLKPDVSFIRNERLTADWMADAYFSIAPDLAVEVLSPNDLAYNVDAKIRLYLRVGVQLVWIVNPEQRTVAIYRADGSVTLLNEDDVLEGEQVIPGFTCACREIFPGL